MTIRSICLAFAAGMLALPAVSLADEVQEQLKQMQERMGQLEDRLQATTDQLDATQQRAKEQQQVIEAAGLAQDGSQSGIAAFLESLEIGGHVSTSYMHNFNRPGHSASGSGTRLFGANGLRAFDQDANGFALDQLKFQLERPVSADQRAGFRTDIYYGRTARILNSLTDSNGNDTALSDRLIGDGAETHLSQAYVQYLIPNVDIKFQMGLMQTFIGAEVIDSPANFNISRSLLFWNAIPTEHLGAMVSKKYESGIDWMVGLVNGWDPSNGPDVNDSKSMIGRIGYGQDMWNLGVNGIYGYEQPGDESDQRGLLDVVLNLKPCDDFAMYFNADFGWEQFDKVSDTADTFWYGFAAAGRYALTERLGIGGRAEWLKDIESAFFNPVGGNVAGQASEAWELTATLDYAFTQSLIGRLEGRADWVDLQDASDKVFRGDANRGSQRTQQTVAAEVIYKF